MPNLTPDTMPRELSPESGDSASADLSQSAGVADAESAALVADTAATPADESLPLAVSSDIGDEPPADQGELAPTDGTPAQAAEVDSAAAQAAAGDGDGGLPGDRKLPTGGDGEDGEDEVPGLDDALRYAAATRGDRDAGPAIRPLTADEAANLTHGRPVDHHGPYTVTGRDAIRAEIAAARGDAEGPGPEEEHIEAAGGEDGEPGQDGADSEAASAEGAGDGQPPAGGDLPPTGGDPEGNDEGERTPDGAPIFRVEELQDFVDEEEFHGLMVQRLQEMGAYRPDLLVCGYIIPDEPPAESQSPRQTTYAYTIEETERNLRYPTMDERTPYQHASAAHLDELDENVEVHGQPVVSVYDPTFFTPIGTIEFQHREYQLREGHTMGEAEIARFMIDFPQEHSGDA